MARFNALTRTLEVPTEEPRKTPRKKPAAAKAVPPKGQPAPAPATKNAARVPQSAKPSAPTTALARLIAGLPPATFALLLKTSDLSAADAARQTFAAWCAARPDLPHDWRAAWTLHTAKPSVTPTAPLPNLSKAQAWLASL